MPDISKVILNGVTQMDVTQDTVAPGNLLLNETATMSNGTRTVGTVDLSTYAPLDSPTFTGTPAAPTAAAGTNTTQIATTAFVQGELSNRPVGLTADLTLHVNATSGNDSNDGLSAATALKTIAAALSKIPKDTAGCSVSISLAAGTYPKITIQQRHDSSIEIGPESGVSVSSVLIQGYECAQSVTNSFISFYNVTFTSGAAAYGSVTNNYHRMTECVFDGGLLAISGYGYITSCTFRNLSSDAVTVSYGVVTMYTPNIENTCTATGIKAASGAIVSIPTYNIVNNATVPYACSYSGRIFVGGRTYKEIPTVEPLYYNSNLFKVSGGNKDITLAHPMNEYSEIILYLTNSSTNASSNRCMVRFNPWELGAGAHYVIGIASSIYTVRLGFVTTGVYTQLRFVSTTAPDLWIVQAVGVIGSS